MFILFIFREFRTFIHFFNNLYANGPAGTVSWQSDEIGRRSATKNCQNVRKRAHPVCPDDVFPQANYRETPSPIFPRYRHSFIPGETKIFEKRFVFSDLCPIFAAVNRTKTKHESFQVISFLVVALTTFQVVRRWWYDHNKCIKIHPDSEKKLKHRGCRTHDGPWFFYLRRNTKNKK